MNMPIACTQPSGLALSSVENSFATTANPTEKKARAERTRPLQRSTFAVQPPPTPGVGSGLEALEAYVLPSSRLANEAACTTTRFIQAPPHLLCPTGVELRVESLPNKLLPDASAVRRGVRSLRGDALAARRGPRGRQAARTQRSDRAQRRVRRSDGRGQRGCRERRRDGRGDPARR